MPAGERSTPAEAEARRENVIRSFNRSLDIFAEAGRAGRLNQRQQAELQLIQAAKAETLDKRPPRATFKNTFTGADGVTYSQREGIPIEALDTFLSQEIASGRLTPEQKEEYTQLHDALIANCSDYDTPSRRRAGYAKRQARIQQEFERVQAQFSTGSAAGDADLARRNILYRRELKIPRKVTASGSAVAAPPVPAVTAPPPPPPPTVSPAAVVRPPGPLAPPVPGAPRLPGATVDTDDGADTEPPPEPVRLEDLRYDMCIANRTADIRKKARELAEEQLREELRRGKWYNPVDWARKAGIRIMEEYFRQRYTKRAMEAMIANNNSYLQMDVVHNAAIQANHRRLEERQAGQAKLEQMREQQREGINIAGQEVAEATGNTRQLIVDHLLKPLIGEITALPADQRRLLADINGDARQPMEMRMQEKLRLWMDAIDNPSMLNSGVIPDPVKALLQDQSVQTQLRQFFGRDTTRFRVMADYFASDVVDIAQRIAEDHEAHHFGIDDLVTRTNILLANASWGAETEARFNNVTDRAIAWAESHRLTGILLNPATIGAATSIGLGLLVRAPSKLIRLTSMAAPVAGGLAGGTVAAFRRSYDLKVDMASHQAERAYGAKKVTRADVDRQLAGMNAIQRRLAAMSGAYRRADLEQFAYNTATSTDLIRGVQEGRALDLTQAGNQDTLLTRIAEIQARLDFSAAEKVDLIEFSGKEQVEQSRLGLIKSIAEAKVALRRAGLSNDQINARLAVFYQQQRNSFSLNRDQQDRNFRHYRFKEATKAGLRGFAVGVTAGLVSEEAITLARRGASAALGIGSPGVGSTTLESWGGKVYDALGKERPEFFAARPSGRLLQALYNEGGSTELGTRYLMTIDQHTHNVTLTDRFTHQILNGSASIIQEPNGQIVIDGNVPAPLQQELADLGFGIKTEVANVLLSAGGPTHVDMTTGFKTVIPDASEWVNNGGNWDLVLKADHSKVLISGAVFSGDGEITSFDSAHSLIKNIGKNVIDTKHDVIDASGEWKEHAVKLNGYEYYHYDQPGSQGNELKLYTFKSGDTVRLSMHNMDWSHASNLSPQDINVPDVYQGLNPPGGRAGFAFSLPGHLGQPIIALSDNKGFLDLNPQDVDPTHLIDYIDTDGTVKKMPLGEFSRMVLNYDAYKGLKDGNIATEAARRFDVWKVGGGSGDKFGFISSGRYIERGGKKIWQSFATIRGRGVTGPIGERVVENFINPIDLTEEHLRLIAPVDSIPLAIPFVPRYPLPIAERLMLPPYYGGAEGGRFGPGARLRDICKRGHATRPLPGSTYGYGAASFEIDATEALAALQEASEAFRRADRIYFVASGGPIGDAVVATGYLRAIQEALKNSGRNVPITIITNQDHGHIHDALADSDITVVNVPVDQGIAQANALISSSGDKAPLVIDFERYTGNPPIIDSVKTRGKQVTTINSLLTTAIEYYNNSTDKSRRYSHFVEELFLLPDDSIDENKAQPIIKLPANENAIYNSIAARVPGFDTSKPQLSLIVEASVPGKRYDMRKWVEVMRDIQAVHPDYQINIVYNPGTTLPGYTKTEMENLFRSAGINNVCFVNGNLQEMAVFFSHQNMVMGNDTGLGHIAGCVEKGPSVLTIFAPTYISANQWVSSKKQKSVELPKADYTSLDRSIDINSPDESRKWINRIKPKDVSRKALEILATV